VVTVEPAPAPASRLAYLDGLRGFAVVLMVLNHTARAWIDGKMTWHRYTLIYVTLTMAAPTFLFLVGFCVPLSLRERPGEPERLGALARRFAPRGVRIFLAGLLLNVIVFRDQSIWSGGVLQTIGLAIVAMIPAVWFLRYRHAAWVLLAVAVAGYVTFVQAFDWLERFVDRHSGLGLVLFYDFPPWPWLSLVLIGLVMGAAWLAAHRRSEAEGARFLGRVASAGAVMVLAWAAWDGWMDTPVRLGMKRDFILNNHWTPRGPSVLWVLGMVWLALGVAYWVMERRRWPLPSLVLLGQTALFLYFVHQIIAFTLVGEWLDWRFNHWPDFYAVNALFLLVLLALGWVWQRLTRVIPELPLPIIGRWTRARARP
jgi:uncharacterized membrane protein